MLVGMMIARPDPLVCVPLAQVAEEDHIIIVTYPDNVQLRNSYKKERTVL